MRKPQLTGLIGVRKLMNFRVQMNSYSGRRLVGELYATADLKIKIKNQSIDDNVRL